MSRDAPIKAEKDYTELLDEQFPQIELLGAVSCGGPQCSPSMVANLNTDLVY
jgi:hypothetical protein